MIFWTTLVECVCVFLCITYSACFSCDAIEDLKLDLDQKYSKTLL